MPNSVGHFLRARRSGVSTCPDSLDGFAVCSSPIAKKIEAVLGPALRPMCWKVKLRYTKPDLQLVHVCCKGPRECRDATIKVYFPLAYNVVGQIHASQAAITKAGEENEIRVNIAMRMHEYSITPKNTVTHRSPFWRSATPFGRRKPCRESTAPTTPVTAYPSFERVLARSSAANEDSQVAFFYIKMSS